MRGWITGRALNAVLAAGVLSVASVEAKTRAEQLLKKLEAQPPTPDQVRALEAVDLLEQLRTPKSVELLREVAQDGLVPRLRAEAGRALRQVTGEEAEEVDRVRYLRPAGKGFAPECEFTLRKTTTGSSIESVTSLGKTRLTVSSHYDERDRLTGAEASLDRDDMKVTVTVAVSEGKARVQRAGQKAQEFEVPPGVIVTSAPDWTDAILLCRRYDRAKGGKQSFPGLWIHPEQAGQRLSFAIERTGEDTVEDAGKKLKLGRYTIWLRGNSSYAAWANETGRLIRLVPLPSKENASNGLLLDGYEKWSWPLTK